MASAQPLSGISSLNYDQHSKYASPVPVIGLYSALATLVCFFCMLYDTYLGFHHKKRWFPCRAFPLNAFTLSLLSIATKLPVDLTSPMPSAQDQLSKLTSTTLTCISIGFFMPSLGIKQESECFWNMAGLTLLALTIIVDVIIQITTGVIFLFLVEHIIVLVCMWALLAVLWSSILDINHGKSLALDHNRRLFEKGIVGKRDPETMIQRLKWCYMYSFSSNPQFLLCQISQCATVAMLCIVCFAVLLVSVSKTIDRKFRINADERGVYSDYRWSVWILVGIQIITTLLGTFTVGFRGLTLVAHMKFSRIQPRNIKGLKCLPYWMYESVFGKLCLLSFIKFSRMGRTNFSQTLEDFLGTLLYFTQIGVVWINNSVVFLCFLVREKLGRLIKRNCSRKNFCGFDVGSVRMRIEEEYKNIVYPSKNGLKKWIVRIGKENMERWMELNKKDSHTHLDEFLSNNSPSTVEESLTEDLKQIGKDNKYEVSCLSVVMLIRMASVALPPRFTQALINTMDEAFEIVYFINKRLNPENFNNEVKLMLARDIWMCKDITCHWFQKKFIGPSLRKYEESRSLSTNSRSSSSDLGRALGIINELNNNSISGFLVFELQTIHNFIHKHGDYETIDSLYDQIKRLFVDMLHLFLSDLPKAIFKYVVESPIDESEKRVSLAMKFLCKIESLENNGIIDWSYPYEIELINGLMKENPTTDTEVSSYVSAVGVDDDRSLVASMDDEDINVSNSLITEMNSSANFIPAITDKAKGCSTVAENQSSSSMTNECLHNDEIQEISEIEKDS